MANTETVRHAFNRGVISKLALARVDLKRTALAAEIQENFMPRKLGPMMLRPGFAYLGSTASNAPSRTLTFVRSLSSIHQIEFTNMVMRVWSNDALLTRAAVSTVVTNGTFVANLAGWTDNDEAGGNSAWVTGGYMGLTGTGTAAAIRDQAIAVAGIYQNVEHALRIVVQRGPVTIRVGTTVGDDDLIGETTLYTGTHSLAFTPAANFNIRLLSRLARIVLVDSIDIEGAGVVSLPSPYPTAALGLIRGNTDSQSVDVMFLACFGYQQRRIERRQSGRSWSLVLFQSDDGPFRPANVSTVTMTPSTLLGNGTLTASVPYFKPTMVGALFQVTSTGQTVTKTMTAVNDVTPSIRVIGIGADRAFYWSITGLTATGNTVKLQRSFDDVTWADYSGTAIVADEVNSVTDGLTNVIVYYRFKCTVYASGATIVDLSIPTGSIIGVARATAYNSTTNMDIEILSSMGSVTDSADWAEGKWSDLRGWPSAVTMFEGRLMWGGFDSIIGSVSDAFDSNDPNVVGDSGPINRSLGSGPMDTINWAMPLQRLIMGAQMAEHSIRSNAFDEPLTPSNFNRKPCSAQGSHSVPGVKLDSRGIFVQRGGSRVFELSFDGQIADYSPEELTKLCPEVCQPYVVRMDVQRQPDTRLHCVLSDGTVAVMVYDHVEQVTCWIKTTSDGLIEDVDVSPGLSGSNEDQVYYTVARTINGSTVRFREKWALESDCQGGTLNKQADAFVICAGGSTVLAGLGHLIGESVVCWANGKDLGVYTVDSTGQITVSETVSSDGAVVGLYYEARFKSARLGDTIGKMKNIDHIVPILINTHWQGLMHGPDFDHMDNLPMVVDGAPVVDGTVHTTYDADPNEFVGTWDTDTRLCLKAWAPRPCTVAAIAIQGQVNG